MSDLFIPVTVLWNNLRFNLKTQITGLQCIGDAYLINAVDMQTGLQVGSFVDFSSKSLSDWIFRSGQVIPDACLEAAEQQRIEFADKPPQCDIFTIKTIIEAPDIGDDIRTFTEDHMRSTDAIASLLASGYQVVGVQLFKQIETYGKRTLEATVRYTTLALYPSKPRMTHDALPIIPEENKNE